MTKPEPGLTDEVRALLTAIRDALDIPAAEAGDDQAQKQRTQLLLQMRVAHLQGALDAILEYDAPQLDIVASVVRRGIANHPVTYRVHTPDTEEPTP